MALVPSSGRARGMLSRVMNTWRGNGDAIAVQPPARREPQFNNLIDAGQLGRRLHAIPSGTHAINQQMRSYGNTTLARSRYLAINNGYMTNGRESFIDAAIGVGIVPSPQTKDLVLRAVLRSAWDSWTDYCDADGLTDFYGLQGIIAGEVFEAGEAFVRFRPRYPTDGFAIPLQLQVLPAEMLPYSRNQDLGNGRRIEMGVQFNAIGQREGYWFLTRHPGNDVQLYPSDAMEVFVPASEVLHIYRPRNAGQVRGLTHTVASITTMAMLDLYDDAELERKRNAALFGAFITRPGDTSDDDDHPFADTRPPIPQNPELEGAFPPNLSGTGADYPGGYPYDPNAWGKISPGSAALEPGAMIDLDEGEKVQFSEPVDVGGSYDPFEYRNLTRGAAGMGVPYAEMTGDLKNANYSSLRAGRVVYKRRIERSQYSMFVHQLCRPVRQRWLQVAVLAGEAGLSPAQYLARKAEVDLTRWRVPAWESHDPDKDSKANQAAYGLRTKSISQMIEENGDEPEEVFDQIEADNAALAERNIAQPTLGPARETVNDPVNANDDGNGTGDGSGDGSGASGGGGE